MRKCEEFMGKYFVLIEGVLYSSKVFCTHRRCFVLIEGYLYS